MKSEQVSQLRYGLLPNAMNVNVYYNDSWRKKREGSGCRYAGALSDLRSQTHTCAHIRHARNRII